MEWEVYKPGTTPSQYDSYTLQACFDVIILGSEATGFTIHVGQDKTTLKPGTSLYFAQMRAIQLYVRRLEKQIAEAYETLGEMETQEIETTPVTEDNFSDLSEPELLVKEDLILTALEELYLDAGSTHDPEIISREMLFRRHLATIHSRLSKYQR